MKTYAPINQLKQVADDIWIVDGPVIHSRACRSRPRMTVIRLSDGSLFIHSPVAADPDLLAAINERGR